MLSSSRTSGHQIRELGWAPQKTRADFEAHCTQDWKSILADIASKEAKSPLHCCDGME